MITNLFTVFDSAAGTFLDPFVAPSIEFAIRSFREAVNKEGHQFNRFPEDFTLYHTGTFNMDTGVTSGEGPTSLGVAVTFINRVRLDTDEETA